MDESFSGARVTACRFHFWPADRACVAVLTAANLKG